MTPLLPHIGKGWRVSDDFYTRIGYVIQTWNDTQLITFYMFQGLSRLSTEEAEAVFLAVSSDKVQADMTKSLGEVRLAFGPSDLLRDFSGLFDRLATARAARNAVAHHNLILTQRYEVMVGEIRSRHNERLRPDYIQRLRDAEVEAVALNEELREMYHAVGRQLAWQYIPP